MNASKLIRWSGLSAMAAGILFIVIQLIHPSDVLSSVDTTRWTVVHMLGVVMSVLGIFGVTGIYARQANATGWLGFGGYLASSLFWIFTMAFQFIEAFVSPALTTDSPAVVQALLAIVGGKTVETDIGALPQVYAVTGGLYLLGGLLLGIATFRAGVLPRLAGSSLVAAAVLPILLAALPHPLDRSLAVPMGLSLAWLGYALWTEPRERASETVADTGTTVLSSVGAK